MNEIIFLIEEAADGGFTARALGLGHMGGRNSPFVRALARLCQFDLAQASHGGTLAVRRKVPPLNRRQVMRLTDALQAAHERWQQQQLATPAHEQARRQDTNTPFLRLDLVFWDTYGMTADPHAACEQVTRLVRADPEPVLRSLNNWGRADLAPEDVCRLPT